MNSRRYHSAVPESMKFILEANFANVKTLEEFLIAVKKIAEPIPSTILQPVDILMDPSFVINGKPDWKKVNPFKKKHEIRRGVMLPFTNETILNESTVWTIRSVVTNSRDYNAFLDSFPLQVEAKRNGYGDSPYASILYIFDILAAR